MGRRKLFIKLRKNHLWPAESSGWSVPISSQQPWWGWESGPQLTTHKRLGPDDDSLARAAHGLQIPAFQRSTYMPPSSPFKGRKPPDKQMTVRSSDLAPEGQREGRGPLQHLLQDLRSWLGKCSPAPHPSFFKHLRAPGKKTSWCRWRGVKRRGCGPLWVTLREAPQWLPALNPQVPALCPSTLQHQAGQGRVGSPWVPAPVDQWREDARLKLQGRGGVGRGGLGRALGHVEGWAKVEVRTWFGGTLVVMVDGLHSPSVLDSGIEIQAELDSPTLLELMVLWGTWVYPNHRTNKGPVTKSDQLLKPLQFSQCPTPALGFLPDSRTSLDSAVSPQSPALISTDLTRDSLHCACPSWAQRGVSPRKVIGARAQP